MSNLDGAKMTSAINLALGFMIFQGSVSPGAFYGVFYYHWAGRVILFGGVFTILGSVALHFGVSSSNKNGILVGLGITGLAAILSFIGMVKAMVELGKVVPHPHSEGLEGTMALIVIFFLVYMGLQALTILLSVGVFLDKKQKTLASSLASEPTASPDQNPYPSLGQNVSKIILFLITKSLSYYSFLFF